MSLSRRLEAVLAQEAAVRAAQQRARATLQTRPADTFPGFGALIASVVPDDELTLALLGPALELHPDALGALIAGDLDAGDVDPDAVVTLARLLSLDRATFFLLLRRDLDARSVEYRRPGSKDSADDPGRAVSLYEEAWEFAEAGDDAHVTDNAGGAPDEGGAPSRDGPAGSRYLGWGKRRPLGSDGSA